MKWFLQASILLLSMIVHGIECGEKYIAIPLSDIEIIPANQEVRSSTAKAQNRNIKLPKEFGRNYYDMGAHTGPNGEYAWHWKTYKAKTKQ